MNDYVIAPIKRLLKEPAFIICCLFLAISAGSFQLSAKLLGLHFIKKPAHLQQALDNLDESVLLPYRVAQKFKIENEDIVDELGTEEYIQWVLEDPRISAMDPARYVSLFITYYDKPDQVPHVPEVCYVGGGSAVGSRENVEVEITTSQDKKEVLPLRVLGITAPEKMAGGSDSVVVYFFSVNDSYACERNQVRYYLRNPLDEYAYFSKVELNFKDNGKRSKEEIIDAAKEIFEKIIPALKQDFWPVWPPGK